MKHVFSFCHALALCCFLLLLPQGMLHAQNLVPNPSFETYTQCPNWISCTDSSRTVFPYVTAWRRPTMATTDYFHTCATIAMADVPFNFAGHQQPRNGSAYMGLIAYGLDNSELGYREYIQSRLLQPLKPLKPYRVSFFVSNGFKRDTQFYYSRQLIAVSSFGAHFGVQPPEQFSNLQWVLPVTPQIANPPGNYLKDTSGWMEVSGVLVAQGGEEWITIGNFRNNPETDYMVLDDYFDPLGNPSLRDTFSYYYIDDISVVPYTQDTVVCDTAGLSYTMYAVSGATSYIWSTGSTQPSITVSSPGVYWYEASLGGLPVRDTIRVSYYSRPPLMWQIDTAVCRNHTVTITAPPGFIGYYWSTGDSSQSIQAKAPNVITVNVLDSCGLRPLTKTITAKFVEPPLAGDTVLCTHAQISQLPVQGQNLLWYRSATDSSGSSSIPQIPLPAGTTQTLYVSQLIDDCESERVPVHIQVAERLSMYLPADTTLCLGERLMLGYQNPEANWYRWNTGAQLPYIQPHQNGIYTLTLANGCDTVSAATAVRFDACTECYWLPDAFTPNGDGRNDFFGPLVRCAPHPLYYVFRIYDRWGQLVFEGQDPQQRWSGWLQGRAMPAGTYFYYLQYKPTLWNSFMQKGSVELIR